MCDPDCELCMAVEAMEDDEMDHAAERIGWGICDGCGEQGELTAFNAPQVACGICICDACMALPSRDSDLPKET